MNAQQIDVGVQLSETDSWPKLNVRFHEFSYLPSAPGVCHNSPKFTCLGKDWHLVVYPGGDQSLGGVASVYLQYGVDQEDIEVEYTIDVMFGNTNTVALHHYSKQLFSHAQGGFPSWGRREYAPLHALTSLLVDGTLTFHIRMKKVNSLASDVAFLPENPLCKNILKKFMNEESADVVFEVGSGAGGDG